MHREWKELSTLLWVLDWLCLLWKHKLNWSVKIKIKFQEEEFNSTAQSKAQTSPPNTAQSRVQTMPGILTFFSSGYHQFWNFYSSIPIQRYLNEASSVRAVYSEHKSSSLGTSGARNEALNDLFYNILNRNGSPFDNRTTSLAVKPVMPLSLFMTVTCRDGSASKQIIDETQNQA